MLARRHTSTAENAYEKKSDYDDEHPDGDDMVSPPPVKVLENRQLAYV